MSVGTELQIKRKAERASKLYRAKSVKYVNKKKIKSMEAGCHVNDTHWHYFKDSKLNLSKKSCLRSENQMKPITNRYKRNTKVGEQGDHNFVGDVDVKTESKNIYKGIVTRCNKPFLDMIEEQKKLMHEMSLI